jgi:hypothetical protein
LDQLPGAQSAVAADELELQLEPAGHGSHTAALASAYVPGSHTTTSDCEVDGQAWPAGHAAHEVALPAA